MSLPSLRPAPGLLIVLMLITAFMAQILVVVHRSAMTNDEGYHLFAGYHYWQCRDFGVNPEHPPFAKLVAALPLRMANTPAPDGACATMPTTKGDGYGAAANWYLGTSEHPARIDADHTLWIGRVSISIFALVLAITAFGFTREVFGIGSSLIAVALLSFEPTLVAHGALVTTDCAVSAMSLLTIYLCYRYFRQPSLVRLALTGLSCGLVLAVKHSGVLILPVVVFLVSIECVRIFVEKKPTRISDCARASAALITIFALAYFTLWAFYTFRYAARPAGSVLSLPLADFIADTTAKGNRSVMLHVIPILARYHLAPEAYLYGFVDVLSISNPGQSSFLLGHLYEHGVPQYFPLMVMIKSTLGMLGLGLLAIAALLRRQVRLSIGALYLLTPIVVWMVAGINATLNIGYRHILPIVVPMCCLIGTAAYALWQRHRVYRIAIVVLVAAHITSSLVNFPNEMAYANEAWGGPSNSYKLLTDSNNDWGQAVNRVPAWLKEHHVQDCWLAYDGIMPPAHYGVHCHYLIQNAFGVGGPPPPASADSTFLISGLTGSGIEWERPDLNPYADFLKTKPVAVIGGAIMVFQGKYPLDRVNAVYQTTLATTLNGQKRYAEALANSQSAAAFFPTSGFAHLQMAHAMEGLNRREEAHAEYSLAKQIADAQPGWYFLQKPEIYAGYEKTQ